MIGGELFSFLLGSGDVFLILMCALRYYDNTLLSVGVAIRSPS